MNIKDELNKLTKKDIYSLLLFALYKMSEDEKYSTLSQLSFVMDKDSLLKFCEVYGGLTIKVPTISQLQEMLEGLLILQFVDIEHNSIDDISSKFNKKSISAYFEIKDILKNYNFVSENTQL